MNKYIKSPQYEYLYVLENGELMTLVDTLAHQRMNRFINESGELLKAELLDSWLMYDSDTDYTSRYISCYLPLPGLPAGSIVMIEPEPSLISKITRYFKEVLKEL